MATTENVKTILVITPYLPYESVGHAGGKAIYSFIVHLKKRGFKVYLASLAWPDESRELESLKRLCDDTFFLISVPAITNGFLNSLQSNPIGLLPQILRGVLKHFRIRRSMNAGIRNLIHRHKPDVVQVEYTTMLLYLAKIPPGGASIIHLHDLMMKPHERLWKAEHRLAARVFRWLFFVVTMQLELSFCRRFEKVLVKSQYDRNLLLQRGKFNAHVFPLGVEPVADIASYESREPRSVLFLGAMYRDVNEKAAIYFIEQVLPRLEQKVGPIKFYVAGYAPSEALKRRAAENIIVTGFVDDVARLYRRCQVFVAPLFVGGGMIFKVLESMSHGLPVVASTVANEGILARDGAEILIADDPEAFSEKIASLVENKELWQRISQQSRRFVNSKYSWDVVIEEYLTTSRLRSTFALTETRS